MKTKLFFLMMLAASALSAQNKLTIVVSGIEEVEGHLIVGLYDKENFQKKPINGQYVKVDKETMTIVLEDILPGEYAVSLFQDENDNQKLDTGFLGIPTEKYGFSNNAKGQFGPPSYEDCKFIVDGDTVIYINF
ncbi:hypothetical protein FACS189440_18000 [Bacteroidia bacterium]|nr:hypothetical protein FACS189440_18000 [Bacteroidia bacterium]